MRYRIQIATSLMTLALVGSLKFDLLGRPTCCSNSLTPVRRLQDWGATLREATYRSLTHHLDYAGTLDGRLARDHALWQLLQQAALPHGDGNNDGVLVEKRYGNRIAFEFRQDESAFECVPGPCDLRNDSIVALWRVRKSDNPYTMWIQVKLPNIKEHPNEDVYEYSAKFGLKKLNPDPFRQYNSFTQEKIHRFSLSKGRSNFKSEERMDLPFAKVFGIGHITPTSFIYDPPALSGQSEDGWRIPQRKPHPGVVVDTGVKNVNMGSLPFKPHSHLSVSGPKGFQHVIHSLPSIPPSQNLDYPSHNLRGFLPSIGPVKAPPPYKTEYVYDPRYVLYYNERPNTTPRFPTQPPKQFKPSTEFIRFSEVDPFYHPHGESDMLSTTPTPFHNYYSTSFPNSINDQLPTNSPIEPTRPPFQIIVGDVKPSTRTTTRNPSAIINKVSTTTEKTKNIFLPRPRTITTPRPATEGNKVTTKPFGEKIKPKTSPQTTPKTREKLTTKSFPQFNKKKISATNIEKKTKTRNDTEFINFTKPSQTLKKDVEKGENLDMTTFKDSKSGNTIPTQPVELSDTTENISEFTTVQSEGKTSNLSNGTRTNEKSKDSEMVKQSGTEDETTTTKIPFGTMEETTPEIKLTDITTKSHLTTKTQKPKTEITTEDYYSDETTEANEEANNNTVSDSKSSGISDFFSSLTDTLFPEQTTTEMNKEITTIVTTQETTIDNGDADNQESKQHNYRLVTFPGDTVSIVANRISKSVSYRTAAGKEGQLKSKKQTDTRYRFSDAYKDYSTFL